MKGLTMRIAGPPKTKVLKKRLSSAPQAASNVAPRSRPSW